MGHNKTPYWTKNVALCGMHVLFLPPCGQDVCWVLATIWSYRELYTWVHCYWKGESNYAGFRTSGSFNQEKITNVGRFGEKYLMPCPLLKNQTFRLLIQSVPHPKGSDFTLSVQVGIQGGLRDFNQNLYQNLKLWKSFFSNRQVALEVGLYRSCHMYT